MDERAERIGRNEALFRKVNDKISDLNESFGAIAQGMTLVCECGDQACIDQIELTVEEYRDVRSDPTIFAVKPDHDLPDVEDVIDKRELYWVVRKKSGGAAEIAAALDDG